LATCWFSGFCKQENSHKPQRYQLAGTEFDRMIHEIQDISWQDFVEQEQKNFQNSRRFLYRGQSNSYNQGNFIQWKLESSFNRFYDDSGDYDFRMFLGQHLEYDLFRIYYGNYKFVQNNELTQADLISKLYYLQHYGIPTCLIDFTHDPLIALYFALTSLKGRSGGRYQVNGDPDFFPDDFKVSIYRFNIDLLIEKLKLKDISSSDINFYLDYEKFRIDCNDFDYAFLGIDLNPFEHIKNADINYNLSKQKGAFLCYDNSKLTKNSDLIEFIITYCKTNNLDFDEPIIKQFQIKYNSLYKPMQSLQPDTISAFRFLDKKGITGKNLFNDYQGLKYDFNFFHQK
jgi:hypothetical protein